MSRVDVNNQLAAIRRKRGISAAALALQAGVSRQTIYAMESGDYVPNTAVALRLAQALEVTVEDLFSLPKRGRSKANSISAELIGNNEQAPGVPVQLCRVDKRMIAVPAASALWNLPALDGVVLRSEGRATIQSFRDDAELNRVLIAGCDPAMPMLARHAREAGVELVLANSNSSSALQLLKDRLIHIGGTHLHEASSTSNLPEVRRTFPRDEIAVITFAVWEQGLVVRAGDPKRIRGIADLSRRDVTIVNREDGSGSRKLLDSELKRQGIRSKNVRGYTRSASGHLAAAWHVSTDLADACLATRAAARAFGLDFHPLTSERYDLVLRNEHLALPSIARLLDVVTQLRFRREIEAFGGYETTHTGERIA